MTRLRRIAPLAAAAALALTMSACSDEEPSAESGEPAAVETSDEPDAVEEATEPDPEVAPEPEHGDLVTPSEVAELPDHLAAVHLGDATTIVAVDGTQPFPEPVISYIQDLIPVTPEASIDPQSVKVTDANVRAQLMQIAEATGRRGVTVTNVGQYDEQGSLIDDSSWTPALHSELVDLAMANQAEGKVTVSFHPTAKEAIAELEGLIAELDDPSVWEIIPPRQ